MSIRRLQRADNYRWDVTGIEFAIKERVGNPQNFIGRVEELEYLYTWADNIQHGISRSLAFLGRRKIGKSLILERLYNIIYSEHKGLIPFYYEFREGMRSGKEFYQDFVGRWYMQLIGYYTRDATWIRHAMNRYVELDIEHLLREIESLEFRYQDTVVEGMKNSLRTLSKDKPLYEYVLAAVDAPRGFATTIGVEDRVVQLLDEFQYLNMYIDAGVEDKPCKAYMSTAESRVAPLLITGSLMAIVSQELARYLPQRFYQMTVPKMKVAETIAMTLNYGVIYDHAITPQIAEYIAHVTNNVPGRIVELLTPAIEKPRITTLETVDRALEYETRDGNIKDDWNEYLIPAMSTVNDVNMRRIIYFLCKHEGEWYYPGDLQRVMSLELDQDTIRKELMLLHKYDLIEQRGGSYGGVFDRTLKKVLMANYADILELPVDEFDVYFKNDNMLDYLKERVEQLELGLAEARDVRHTLQVLRGEHNDLKGHYYEREVLLELLKAIIDRETGLVEGMSISNVKYTLNYHLETGQELDIVLEGERTVVIVECKHYAPDNLDKITTKMVDEFVDKANRLKSRFPGKEIRLGFFSKHGFEEKMQTYLWEKGIVFTLNNS